MMNRARKDGYVSSERAAGLADLLYHVVVKLDTGTPPFQLADDVANLAKAMRG